jgi:hypothetical protein
MEIHQPLCFSYNWNNKLDCKFFTTIRLQNPKYILFKKVSILLKDVHVKNAEIRYIKRFKLDDLTAFVAGLDTGYSTSECEGILKKMYPDAFWSTQILYLILLETI